MRMYVILYEGILIYCKELDSDMLNCMLGKTVQREN